MVKKNKQVKKSGCCGTFDLQKEFDKARHRKNKKLLVTLIVILVLLNLAFWPPYLKWKALTVNEYVCYQRHGISAGYYGTDDPYCAFYYASDDWTCKSEHGKGPRVHDAESVAVMACSAGLCDIWYTTLADIWKRQAKEMCFNSETKKDVAQAVADARYPLIKPDEPEVIHLN